MERIHPIPAGISYEGRGLCLACFSDGVIVEMVYARDVCPNLSKKHGDGASSADYYRSDVRLRRKYHELSGRYQRVALGMAVKREFLPI